MEYFPYNPLPIPKLGNGLVDATNQTLSDFWCEVDDQFHYPLSEAVGCYVFSIRAGRGVKPWYVGLAEKQTFKRECFTPHKLNHYNNAIAGRKGTPLLTLIPRFTPTGRLSKPSRNGYRDMQFLENMLIGTCVRRNPELANVRDTKMLREMIVHGFLNNPMGRNFQSVSEFKDLIGD